MNWIASNHTSILEWSAGIFALAVGRSWYRTFQLFGPVPWRLSVQMLAFTWHTPKAILLLSCVTIEIGCCGAVVTGLVGHGDAVALAFLALYPILTAARPPAVVFLTNSSPRSGELFRYIRVAIAPLRCVALLDFRRLGALHLFEMVFDNLRTRNEKVWKSVVHHLIEIAPVVVVDARPETGPVASEAFWMLAPERAGRAIFLVGGNGEAPALKEHGIEPLVHGLRTASDTTLALSVRRLLKQRRSFIRAQVASCLNGREIVEDHGALSHSVVLIVLTDAFDSKFVIQTVIDSGKDVLQLLLPFAEIDNRYAEKCLQLFYGEFSLDRKLAMIVCDGGKIVLIRRDFIIAQAQKLEPRYASMPMRHLTFEELNQPNPVIEAAFGFISELAANAKREGLNSRVVEQ